MKFIYAKELKKIFKVDGHFYNLTLSDSTFKCRSVLEIKRKIPYYSKSNVNKEIPDIIVIMMNPGSSRPKDKKYLPKTFSKNSYPNAIKELIPTCPDIAQYQIMRIMLKNNWNFVRVLNLSDIRNGDSGKFQVEFKRANDIDNDKPHCITYEHRRSELVDCLESKTNMIIAAWGDIKELNKSADSIIKMNKKIIGIEDSGLYNYRYASPRNLELKVNWLINIQKLIETNINTYKK